MKFWFASVKTLTNCKNPSSNPLHTASCGIQEPTYDYVICLRKPEMILKHVTVLLFITGG
jgi:hypothetical protein